MGVKALHHTSKGFINTSERKQNYLGIILWWKLDFRKSVNHRSRSTIQKGGLENFVELYVHIMGLTAL
jgi:hypothetical protein